MGFLFSVFKYFFKGIGYFLFFTLPVIFCLAGLVGGFLLGAFTTSEDHSEYFDSRIDAAEHTVTIWWDPEGALQSKISVREDINWDMYGSLSAWIARNEDTSHLLYYYDAFMDGKNQDKTVKQYQFVPWEGIVNEETGMFYLRKEAQKEGKQFLGLFTLPDGGEQFVNGAGYSLRDVTSDILLYAQWKEI